MEPSVRERTDRADVSPDGPAGATAVAGVSLKLPPFWTSDPAIWFAQVEAQFDTRGITQEKTKFSYIIASLQPEVATEIRDLIVNPPATEPYSTLKAELVRRMSTSEQKRLNKLLISEELGDRTPSQLLRRMQQLLGEKTLEPSILRQLFMQRLPVKVQLILASTKETMDIHELAALADKIVEVATTSVASVEALPQAHPTPSRANDSDVHRLTAQVAQLTAQVRALTATVHDSCSQRFRSRSRGRSSSRNRRPDRSPSRSRECWYHWNFGKNARKCTAPCSWQTDRPSSQQENGHAGD